MASHSSTIAPQKNTRIVFFGTPELSLPTLEALIKHYTVVGVVTQPDKPVGRKQVLTSPPVKLLAQQHGIPVFQPRSLKQNKESGQAFLAEFKALQPDVVILIAYGKIIPKEILEIPKFGFINIHVSLLPLLRGASPIQSAILHGFTTTGATVMLMDEGMDTGPTLSQREVAIDPQETSITLHDKLKTVGAELLIETLPQYLSGELQPQQQDESQATYCKLIDKTDGEIDWSASAVDIDRKIRAFTPWPGAYTFCNNKRVKLLQAHLSPTQELMIDHVQPEGKKPMSYADFLRGNPDCQLPPRS